MHEERSEQITAELRLKLPRSGGTAIIRGAEAASADEALANLARARREYSSGPGWGGPG